MALSTNDIKLEEFRAIRSEILKVFDRRSTLFNVCATLTSALLGASVVGNSPEISCLASILICTFWIDDINWLDHTAKLGSYVRIILEPDLEGLKWEYYCKHLLNQKERDDRFGKHIYLIISRYPMMAVTSYAFTLLLLFRTEEYDLSRVNIILSLLLFSLILFYWPAKRAQNFHKRHKYWDKLFSDINIQKKNC